MSMTSSRPYVIRALHEWIVENGCTPHIIVNALALGVEVPQEHVRDGQIILNISASAAPNLAIGDHAIDFDGRFAGIPKRVHVPVVAVLGIVARENGQGMFFEADGDEPDPSGSDGPPAAAPKRSARRAPGKKPALRLVK